MDPDRYWMIGSSMSEDEQSSLVRPFDQNLDIFAWAPHEMAGVDPDVISHKLGLDPKARPVMQKQRKLAPERQAVVSEEVDKFLEADAI